MVNWNNIEILIDEVQNPEGNILFIHGFTGNFKNKIGFRHFFNKYNFYGINLPGHGNSKYESITELNQKYFVEIIVQFIEKYNLNNLIILGHSMGGGLALIVANILKDRVKKLILESPANFSVMTNLDLVNKLLPNSLDETKFIISKLIYDPIKFFGTEKNYNYFIEQEYKNLSKRTNLRNLLDKNLMDSFFKEIQKAITSVRIPTLLILGEKDEIVPTSITLNNFKINFSKENLSIIIVKDASHLPLSEDKNIIWNVKKFLTK